MGCDVMSRNSRQGKSGATETDIVVNVGTHETRVAILEDGRLVELKLEREAEVLGNVYKGRVENVVPGLDAAFVDVGLSRNVFLYVGDAIPENGGGPRRGPRRGPLPKIADVVREGQEILVQVTKSPIGKKGARATCRISLPGRYLVLMVHGGKKVGVSKKIEDEAERDRLRKLAEKLRPPEYGLIVRTQAEEAAQRELQADVKYLMRLWESIQRRSRRHAAPVMLHEDLGLVYGVVRDVFSKEVRSFIVDDEKVHRHVLSLLEQIDPGLKSHVQLYTDDEPIFERYGVEQDVERALRPRVWLRNGGWIQIDQGEALTTIDVNTGKFTRTGSLADTVLKTNVLAAEEVGRQLRLRDIGGILVIDFIDMENARHRREVMTALRRVLKNDRMKTRIIHLTPLGLVEMTRKRTADSLVQRLQTTCPCCEGRGRVLSPETMAVRIMHEIEARLAKRPETEAFLVRANPAVIQFIVGEGGQGSEELEERLGRKLFFRGDPLIGPEVYHMEEGSAGKIEALAGVHKVGDQLEVTAAQVLETSDTGSLACVSGYLMKLKDVEPPEASGVVRVELIDATRSYGRATAVREAPKRRRRRSSGRSRRKAKPSKAAEPVEQPAAP